MSEPLDARRRSTAAGSLLGTPFGASCFGAALGALPYLVALYSFPLAHRAAVAARHAMLPLGDRLAAMVSTLVLMAPDIILLSLAGFVLGRWLASRPVMSGWFMGLSYVGLGLLALPAAYFARPHILAVSVFLLAGPVVLGLVLLAVGCVLRARSHTSGPRIPIP